MPARTLQTPQPPRPCIGVQIGLLKGVLLGGLRGPEGQGRTGARQLTTCRISSPAEPR